MSASFFFLLSLGLPILSQGKSCGPLPEVANSDIEYKNGTRVGDEAVVTCNQGYILVGKSGAIRCDDRGWRGKVPTCEEVKCLPPATIENGDFSPQKEIYGYREVVRYSCKEDLTLVGTRELSCSDDEKFSPSAPTCVLVECEDPQIKNAVWESGSRPPHRHKASVTYGCKSGYQMTGQRTLTCEINSKWSSEFPECRSSGNAVVGGLIGALVTIPILLVQNYWM